MVRPRETPGSTTRRIIDHVRRHGGDTAVATVVERAATGNDLASLVDDARWFTYADKIALFDAAAEVLDDPDVARHVGESVFDGPLAKLIPVLRSVGSPGACLRALMDASGAFCPAADMDAVDVGEHSGTVRYRLHPPHEPSRHDCGLTVGLLTRIGPIFGLPPAEVHHPACQVDGADACVYHVRWATTPKPRRLVGRRARRDRLRGLSARFWELEAATLDLVREGEPREVLETIAERAAEAVGASGHLLVLTDPDGSTSTVVRGGLVGATAAFVGDVMQGLVEDGAETRLVVELASPEHRYGHLVLLFDDGHEPLPEERTILEAHARNAAVALDAAAAMVAARLREETASVLLRLARSLADLATVEDVAARVAEAAPMVLGAEHAAVFMWEPATQTFRAAGIAGVTPEVRSEVLHAPVALDAVRSHLPPSVELEPVVIPRAAATGPVAEMMDRHGETWVAVAPIRLRGRLHAVLACGWPDTSRLGPGAVLVERLVGIADQAATALDNASLLERVRHQALHDALTGLPNRTLFADRVDNEVRRSRRNGARVAVGVLDLDRFKTVNDSLGHRAGDQLLVEVADRIAGAVRSPDTIARMGGDEFTLLLPDVHDAGESVIAERILEAFVQPFEVEGHRLRISPSIGLATFPDDGSSFEQLLRCADVAMYRAKERGRNTWARYARGMAEGAYDRLTLENDLYRALQRRELRVAYQAIARLGDGGIVGSEALVRWAHPTLGLLLPEEFLPIADELGLMAEIDGWVLRQACLELGASTNVAGAVLDHVSVNLSARTLCHPALERIVVDALAAGGLEPSRLVLEVTDADTVEPVSVVADALRRLRAHGVRVCLDDFGRGHSALIRLEHLPIDRLKVDAGFLAGIVDADTPAPVAEAIVAMGHGLGVEVCAEGVETEAHLKFAARIGVDLAQGWLVGRPAAALDYLGARSRTA